MTDIPIPPEAIEAHAKIAHQQEIEFCLIEHPETRVDDYDTWEEMSEAGKEGYRKRSRAACRAMLENWPGMAYRYRMSVSLEPQEIILPLQENTNDKG